MYYKSFLPSPQLREIVRNFTIIEFQFSGDAPIPSKQRSPKPEQKIVFYLKGLPQFYDAATGKMQQPCPVTVFSHQHDRKIIRMTSAFSAFIIFLQPGVLHRFTRLPMMELLHRPCDGEILFGTELRSVSERLSEAATPFAMISITEQFLLRHYGKLVDHHSIDQIALHLLGDPTSFSLDAIARQACLSTKQFYRRFTERIGISPKLFSRLSRFNHAYRYKIAHPGLSWTAVANEFHYTDYHHLEKEFKEFTLLTPENWTKVHLTSPERILNLR
jgi:AraC-like DNA-binding protein